MQPPQLEFAFRLEVSLGPMPDIGAGRAGHRRIITIIGGTVGGHKASGHILNLGADWQTIFANKRQSLIRDLHSKPMTAL